MQNPQLPSELRDIFDSVKQMISNNNTGFGTKDTTVKVAPEALQNSILAALASGDKNLAQIVRAIGVASGKTFKPSDGSVSLELDSLLERSLVESELFEDRKVFRLTESGSAHLASLDQATDSSENEASETETTQRHSGASDCSNNILTASAKFANAVSGIAQSGDRNQKIRATELVDEVTRKLYKILAED